MNEYPVVIRPCVDADIPAVVALFRAAARSTFPRDYSVAQVNAWAPDIIDMELFAERCQAKPTWVAECRHQVTGFCDLEADGHIDMLYVDPEHHRRGIASALLDHLERVARAGSIERLYTEASITARPLFERRGYRCVAGQTVAVRGVSMINFKMEKFLDAR